MLSLYFYIKCKSYLYFKQIYKDLNKVFFFIKISKNFEALILNNFISAKISNINSSVCTFAVAINALNNKRLINV